MSLRRFVIVLFFSAAAFAQTASLTGRVTDQTGAVVPGAAVSVTSDSSGVKTSVKTNNEGLYSVSALLPGTYTVVVSKDGFQILRQTGLELAVQQVAKLDLTLQMGALTQTIQVQAQSILLESETSTVGQVIQNKQISDLPLLGRNTYALAMLVPGVRPSGGVNNLVIDQISTVSYSINGQRATANEFLLDGAPNSAPSQNQPVINANPDMVQEFKVETNSFSAEYGRAAGGVFNVITRSGSNDYHFSLYEFLRNDKLNANDFFANHAGQERPPFKLNQFGGTIGGPVRIPKLYDGRNRTFFFIGAELVRFVEGITFTGTVPRADQLAGDFTNTLNAAGKLITIYDPLTTRGNPSGSGSTRTAFPGNRIPADRFDLVARNAAHYFPAPNAAGNPFTGVNNYVRVDGNRVNKDSVSYRIDHYFNDRNRFFARYSTDDTPFVRAAPYGRDNPASPGAGPQDFGRSNTVVEDTHTFSPTLIGTLRYSYTRLTNFRTPVSNGFDLATLGLPANLGPQIEPRAFPNFGITGFSVSGSIPNIVVGGALGATDLIRLANETHAAQSSLTKSLTRHTLKAGFEYRVIRFNNTQTGANSPLFTFTPAFTQGANPSSSSATAGYAFASFLLGYPASASVTPAPALANQTKYFGGYIQDTFKATSRLTLNLGLRWEMETPRTDRFNQLTNFDYNSTPPLNAPGLNLKGVLTFVGVDGLPRTNTKFDGNNFAPRLGFAYQATPKTVLRGGAGIFYASVTGIGSGIAAFGLSGFTAQSTMVTSLDGFTPYHTLSNPYPEGLNKATGSSLGPATQLGQNISFTDRGNVTPYSGQWNFNIQREWPGKILFEVGYLGSRGLKFPQGNRQLNQLPDAALALGNGLRTQVANPFFGQVDTGPLAQPTVARAQLLRPYPHFLNVTSQNATFSNSTYHALTAKVEKRFARGLNAMGSYTYSKNMDLGIGPFAGETVGGGGYQNWNDLRSEWSVSTLDQTQRLLSNVVYELPFWKSGKHVTGKLLGGWQISGIVSLLGGGPLGISSSTNNTYSQGGGQRPNWTGVSAKLDHPTPERWLDTTQFANPPAYTFGNSARTYSGLRSDGTRQLDISLIKNTKIAEKVNLQFRAESFNVTNTPRFEPPNQTFGNAQFGVVSAMGNLPRVMQFALKLSY